MAMTAEKLVKEGIQEQFDSSESQRVGSFVEGVENRVEAKVEGLRVVYGDAVNEIAGDAMETVEGYRETQLNIYDPDFKVKNTEAEDAAAWNEKGGDNSIAIGEGGMQLDIDKGYWGRVVTHEEAHQLDQAAMFDLSVISYPDDAIEVNPTLVEWHAITMARQPDAELTPEYREHKRRGDALVAFLGSDAPLKRALKSGKMSELQKYIDEKLEAQPLRKAG